ncbi:hypothetical protein [Nocardia wallacei]|uniref:hypothetical protein n=1 Tax=Nocardia wallacei TaxID=480035 RepID=UPI0024589C9A|nr:hypothetical protein [Nocardia wallacei]
MTCRLGPTSATVTTNHHAVQKLLREFYTTTDRANGSRPGWTVTALVGDIEPAMAINRWGVGFTSDLAERRLRLRCPDPENLAITTRKAVREVLVDYCEQRGYVMLHAAAVTDDHRVIIIVGDKGSGKTTLALKAALRHGMRYLSNDHLIIIPSTDGGSSSLSLTALPTPIPLKIGTFLDLETALPAPWDTEGLDIDSYRAMPRPQLYQLDRRVLYTLPQLGHPSPAVTQLGTPDTGPAVLIVLAAYTRGEIEETEIPSTVDALLEHVRMDWMFDSTLNQRHLPRLERGRSRYQQDARRLVGALADRATVIGWNHHGDPAPLFDHPGLHMRTS